MLDCAPVTDPIDHYDARIFAYNKLSLELAIVLSTNSRIK
jgi:hypothetical protein